MSTTTANMGLAVPSVGDTDYPTSISSSLTSVDAHDHTSTKGVQIPAGGLASNSVITAKINDLAVTTAKINDLAVTTGKIAAGAVTRAKLESVGQQISSASGVFVHNTSTLVDVPNLSVTVTTTGRPIMIGLLPIAAGPGCIRIFRTSDIASGTISLFDGATGISSWEITATATGATSVGTSIPCGAVNFLYVVAAGTYTFKIMVNTAFVSTITVDQVKLFAYEL